MSNTTDNNSNINSVAWSLKKRTIARVLWLSFLCAAIGFFIIFGLIDPGSLNLAFSLPYSLSRELGYGLGFIFLFFICLLTSSLTAWMISSTENKKPNTSSKFEQ